VDGPGTDNLSDFLKVGTDARRPTQRSVVLQALEVAVHHLQPCRGQRDVQHLIQAIMANQARTTGSSGSGGEGGDWRRQCFTTRDERSGAGGAEGSTADRTG
jgi:uncharacterized membrane protein YgcG